jgi:hypothetical protein
MKRISDNPYKARALAAYFRSGEGAVQPGEPVLMEDDEGKRYVVLSNEDGILAVYRVRNDDMLKRLKRWPAALGKTAT